VRRDLVSMMFAPFMLQVGFDGLFADHRARRPYVPPTRTHQPDDRPRKSKKP